MHEIVVRKGSAQPESAPRTHNRHVQCEEDRMRSKQSGLIVMRPRSEPYAAVALCPAHDENRIVSTIEDACAHGEDHDPHRTLTTLLVLFASATIVLEACSDESFSGNAPAADAAPDGTHERRCSRCRERCRRHHSVRWRRVRSHAAVRRAHADRRAQHSGSGRADRASHARRAQYLFSTRADRRGNFRDDRRR